MTDEKKNVLNPGIASGFSPDIIPVQPEAPAASSEENEQRSALYQLPALGIAFASKPADALAMARTRGRKDEYDATVLHVGDVTITLDGTATLSSLGAGASKVLDAATMAFTAVNRKGQNPPRLRVFIGTVGLARKYGAEIEPRQMDTPEEQAAENKRAKSAATNFTNKMRRALQTLISYRPAWAESIRGELRAYTMTSIISGFRVTRKSITVTFSLDYAEYLVSRPERQLPDTFYRIDENRDNAWAIARYLNEHYSIDKNVMQCTEGILSISSILGQTDYPSAEDLRHSKSKRSWRDRIKERFEDDLSHLTKVGVLDDWHYSYSKNRWLTDEEIDAISSYEEYASIYLWFKMANYPEHKERAIAIAEKRTEQAKENAKKAADKRHRAKKAQAEGGE